MEVTDRADGADEMRELLSNAKDELRQRLSAIRERQQAAAGLFDGNGRREDSA